MTTPVVELRDIGFGYDERQILRAVNLSVGEGELVLVAGRTGSGKSTLLGVVTGLVPRFSGGHLSGQVHFDGASIIDAPPRERAHLIGYVGQDPAAGFVTDTVEEELAYGMEQLGLPQATMRRRVEETLDLLGIAALRHRDLRALSGGEQQRVAIGSVLTMHPRLLVLDEPTSALDPTAAEEVLATITRLVHDLGVSVVLAEHRLERVVPFADSVAILTGEGGISAGPPAEMFVDSPVAPPIVELGRAAGWSPLPLTVREARRRAADLRDRLGEHRFVSDLAAQGTCTTADDSVLVHGLTVAHGSTVALREVTHTLASGQVTALMGRNGSGKSSLIWALQGSGPRTAGRVLIAGSDPAALNVKQRRDLVGLIPQSAADLLYLETVTDECAAAGPGARELLDRLAPGIDAEMHPRDLSEGQRLALVLAIVLVTDPPVLLLDEPTRGLDYAGKVVLGRVLADLAAQGRTVLVATHDVEFAAAWADQVVVLAEGEVVSAGSVREVLTQSPAFAPQVTKILGAPWLSVADVREHL